MNVAQIEHPVTLHREEVEGSGYYPWGTYTESVAYLDAVAHGLSEADMNSLHDVQRTEVPAIRCFVCM